MTAARSVVAGLTYLMTRRCTQRQMLLRPEPMVDQIFQYCLGESAERHGITLHAFIAMSNHEHLLVRDNLGNFPEFLARFHKMVAKAMNALRGRSENFWAAEQPNAVYLVEPQDRFGKLVYLLANPVADSLVDRVSDWPGASSLPLHLSGRTRTVKRPRCFFREDGKMPAEVTLRIERPEGFEALTEDEWRTMLEDAVRREEERARKERIARGGSVLGRKSILRADPMDTPKTVEPRRKLRPCIACLDKTRRVRELGRLLAFRAERQAALLRYVAGETEVIFPYGTYRVRGVFLAKPPPSASSTALALSA